MVRINKSHNTVSCELCRNTRHCVHRVALSEYLLNISGGESGGINIREEFKKNNEKVESVYDKESDTFQKRKEKNLKCLSEKKIPVPRCYSIDDDIDLVNDEDEVKEIKSYYECQHIQMATQTFLGYVCLRTLYASKYISHAILL